MPRLRISRAWLTVLSYLLLSIATTSAQTSEGQPEIASPRDVGISDRIIGTTPLPKGAMFQREPGEDMAGGAATAVDTVVAYSNTLGRQLVGPADIVAGMRIADDIALTCAPGSVLVDYKIRVTGDLSEGGFAAVPYSVDVALYDGCPGASQDSIPIPGTEAHFDFPDNGLFERTVTPLAEVALPSNVYLALTFSRRNCGTVMGAPATIGFSADRFDFPGFPCIAWHGGYPGSTDYFFPHASFFTEIRVQADTCNPAFVGYKNSNQDGLKFSKGDATWFAEDVQLAVPDCDMTAYEVTVKGDGRIDFAWRSALINGDLAAGRIVMPSLPRQRYFGIGNDPQVVRFEFEEPIRLPESGLWFSALPASSSVGLVLTNRPASVGTTEDLYAYYDNAQGVWVVGSTTYSFASFDLTIFCAGELPQGACCDLINTDEQGEAVCRELPEMNCGFPNEGFWQEDKRCGAYCWGGVNDGAACTNQNDCAFCVGGDDDGLNCDPDAPDDTQCPEGECDGRCSGSFCTAGLNSGKACSRQADCPGSSCVRGERDGLACDPDDPDACPSGFCRTAACPGPFSRSCGVAACCQAGGGCDNFTENQCEALEPLDVPRTWNRGNACNSQGFHCPGGICVGGTGSCYAPHPWPGCDEQYCCEAVCNHDFFCCTVIWDEACAQLAFHTCIVSPANDECSSPYPAIGARLVAVPSSSQSDQLHASENPTDPGFCCHEGLDCPGGTCEDDQTCVGGDRDGKACDLELAETGPGSPGYGTVWYKFVATETSAQVKTCGSNSPAKDSLILAFSVANPDRGVCDDLSPCSVLANDCTDGATCQLDEQYACGNLNVLGCDDDTVCSGQASNSLLCLTNLTVGETYYVMVASKTRLPIDAPSMAFRFVVQAPCVPDQLPMPNDDCDQAIALEGGYVSQPFDISGETEGVAPAELGCSNEPCVDPFMLRDVWYDWTAPANGAVTIDTCNRLGSPDDQTDSTIVVYHGCDCPTFTEAIMGCSLESTDECGLSAQVNFDAVAGQCYKIRLGGNLRETPSGTLNITQGFPECPAGQMTLVDPQSGTVDARRPHPPGESELAEGIDSLVINAPPGATDPKCWSVCESRWEKLPIAIVALTDLGDGTKRLQLNRPITTGASTTIRYVDMNAQISVAQIHAHPADVDGNGVSSAADILAIIDALNGVTEAPWGLYSLDCDHSGSVGASDILCVIDLLNGSLTGRAWIGTRRPDSVSGCP